MFILLISEDMIILRHLLNPEIMEAEEIPPENRQLDCLLPKGKVTFAYLDEDDDEEEELL